MSDIRQARSALAARLLDGPGTASSAQRRAAFDNAAPPGDLGRLIDKVANDAGAVGDADVGAVLAAGLSEDEVFELGVCAAAGAATRQYEVALTALDAATQGA